MVESESGEEDASFCASTWLNWLIVEMRSGGSEGAI